MNLFGAPIEEEKVVVPVATADPACRLGLAVSGEAAIEVGLDTPGLREALEDPAVPKDVHDLKAVLGGSLPNAAVRERTD